MNILDNIVTSYRIAPCLGLFMIRGSEYYRKYNRIFSKIISCNKIAYLDFNGVVKFVNNEDQVPSNTVSFCIYNHDRKSLESNTYNLILYYIFTLPDHRGRGLGSSVVAEVIKHVGTNPTITGKFYTVHGDKMLKNKITKNWFYEPYEENS